jgi:hypothetical protein
MGIQEETVKGKDNKNKDDICGDPRQQALVHRFIPGDKEAESG